MKKKTLLGRARGVKLHKNEERKKQLGRATDVKLRNKAKKYFRALEGTQNSKNNRCIGSENSKPSREAN